MNRIIAAAAVAIGLAGCANVPADNATLCGAALVAANSTSASVLFQAALASPACVALGMDALAVLINDVSAKQMARGVRG
jgi:hypothetical protein